MQQTHGYAFSRKNRPQLLSALKSEKFDVLIIGGGINGASALAALTLAGYKTALAEKNDFASFTSQASSNLVWGGIKYMENYEFALVSKLCRSRNRLMRNFPENVREIRFLSAHEKKFRYPLWFMYAGIWLYQIIGRFYTQAPRLMSRNAFLQELPVANGDLFDGGFEYSDAYLPENDARFVFKFIKQAFSMGAVPVNYTEVVSARREHNEWICLIKDISGEQFETRAGYIINAAGPYADSVNRILNTKSDYRHVFSKGIHLIFPRFTENTKIQAFFASDGRLFFVIPMGACSCVGTTDTPTESPESAVTPEDRRFVLENINRLMKLPVPLTEADIIAERCGVRPLAVEKENPAKGDWFQLSREHKIHTDREQGVMSLYGGKLTDCLNIGEEILDLFRSEFGEEVSRVNMDALREPDTSAKKQFMESCRRLDLDSQTPVYAIEPISQRLWRRYSEHRDLIPQMLTENPSLSAVIHEGIECYQIEAELSKQHEMVCKPEDFLRRRSLISLTVPASVITDGDVAQKYQTALGL